MQQNCDRKIKSLRLRLKFSDISNLNPQQRKGFYSTVYSSHMHETLIDKPLSEQPSTSKGINNDILIEKENIHANKTKLGMWILVKVRSLQQDYIYLGKALTVVDNAGGVNIMFFKSVDDTATKFRLVETDLSYEPFDNLLAIVLETKKVNQGKILYYQFVIPLEIFEIN